ncbi:HEAT repeat domain-containing protein [bacterium]|nr:HEAT repeat domain-containing protein [bacterium]
MKLNKKEYALHKLNQFRDIIGQDFRDLNVQRIYSETIKSLTVIPKAETKFLVEILELEYDKVKKGEGSILVCGPICNALAEYKEGKAAPIISRMLIDPVSEPIREDLAEILGELGEQLAQPFLIQVFSDRIAEIRAKAARSLGQVGNKKAIQPLIDLLEDESEVVRDHAINALVELKAVEALPSLKRILENDEDAYVRAEAKAAISELKGNK